jgi:lysyl-tRNA synthetase class 2
MGKAGFAHLMQNGERLQVYVKKDQVGERDFQLYQQIDIGDIIGVEGYLFRTRTGELSVHVERIEHLAKTLLSMPEKWHGLEDGDALQAALQPSLILIPTYARSSSRAKLISSFRRQLEARGFEVERLMQARLWRRARSSPTTTRWISTCTCASPRNFT